ncbi:snake venom 5'-nucleotidase-like isoform X2 [Pollicipes pollicipes]|nr:snake venom 5'-nucleotidase-like isoform X2 [Pollicipes pollicipes]XP_037078082.1 snake venom 5'-nucleotidase-like isoform X2 [Pollicipes pollicipes]XP_037078083.1 snake venom 5'-nucleotidase-like isoform X2 [Pollicipes pollicipes]
MISLDSGRLTIVHFNDVYNIEAGMQEPVGGAARFVTAVEQYKHLNPMVIFSGDIFSPSLLSTFARGEHMIPVLNRLEVHVAVYGNHDFDFGLDSCMSLTAETSFPWLLSNVRNKETQRPLAEGRITYITRWNGLKLGFMGLVEYEWLETLSTVNPDEVHYIDYVDMGNRLAAKLRSEGCDLVIALTHMRTANDMRLLEKGDGIDLILGGHDHEYEIHRTVNRLLVKSGTDFREFSVLGLSRQTGGTWTIDVDRIEVTSKYDEDPLLKQQLQHYIDMSETRLDDVIGHFEVALEGRSCKVRTEETNLGNFCSDVILAAMNADCVILNSGTLRSDRVHPAGDFTMRDLVTIAPFMDGLVLLQVNGATLHQALENAVSMYPRLVGRFPQVAGLSFVFDPDKEPGQRVDARYVKVGDVFVQPGHLYKLATKEYMHHGKDGFTCLAEAVVLQDAENSPVLRTAILNHFDAINRLRGYCGAQAAFSAHRQSIVPTSRRNSRLKSTMELSGFKRPESTLLRRSSTSVINLPPESSVRRRNSVQAATALTPHTIMDALYNIADDAEAPTALQRGLGVLSQPAVAGSLKARRLEHDVEELESRAARLAPAVENRICIATPQVLERVQAERNLVDLVNRDDSDSDQ